LKTQISQWKSIFLFLPIVLLIFSCNKKPDTLGLDLVDGNKGVIGFDTTFNVFAFSELDDSVQSNQTSLSLLGSMQTATFGRVDASFYTHIRLSQVYPDFGNNPLIDSAVFTMVYSGYYGNINTPQTVVIHKVINESILTDTTYYADASFEIGPAVLGSKTFTPNPNDTILIDSVASAPELRIPLSNTFGQELLNLDTSNYETSAKFIEYLKGLYVGIEPVSTEGEGAILYFNLLSDRSNVTLYYRNNAEDSLSYVFLINDNCARVGNFSHDYSLSTDPVFLEEVINTQDPGSTPGIGQEKLYLEGLGGIRTIIKFPGLSEWAENKNPLINEAKLVITSENNADQDTPPDKLILFKIKSANHNDIAFTADQSTFTDDYYGGGFNEDQGTYTFRLSLYIQSLLLGETDYGLVLYPNAKAVRANGLVFGGTNPIHPEHLKLKLTYTPTE